MKFFRYVVYKVNSWVEKRNSIIGTPESSTWALISLFLFCNFMTVLVLFIYYFYPDYDLGNILTNKILIVGLLTFLGIMSYILFISNNRLQNIMSEFKNEERPVLGNILVGIYIFISLTWIITVPTFIKH